MIKTSQLNRIKRYCNKSLLDVTISDEHIMIGSLAYRIVPDNIDIFNEDFKFIPALEPHRDYIELEGEEGYFYEFGGRYYTLSKDYDEFKFNELKYVNNAVQKLPTNSFLGVRSGYEMLNGIGLYETWIKKAKFLGIDTLAICEKRTFGGALAFQKECKKEGIKSVFGMTVPVENKDGQTYEVKIYVKNRDGWNNALQISHTFNIDNRPYIEEDELLSKSEGLIIVIDPKNSEFKDIQHFIKLEDVYYQLDTVEFNNKDRDKEYLNNLELFIKSDLKPVSITDAFCLEEEDIFIRTSLWKIAKAFDDNTKNQYFKNKDAYAKELIGMFEEGNKGWIKLFKEAVKNENDIASKCNFKYDTNNRHLPRYEMTEEESKEFKSNEQLFLHLINKGFKDKDIKDTEKYFDRVKEEIRVLKRGNVIDYFLYLYDIIKNATEQGIIVGIGRGCFVKDSKVKMFDKSLKNIQDIKVGDEVFNHFYGKATVKDTFVYDIDEEIVELEFNNGQKIKCTKDHKILTKNRGWIEADKLKSSDDIVENKRQSYFNRNVNKFNFDEQEYLSLITGGFKFTDAINFINKGFSSKEKYHDICSECKQKYSKGVNQLKNNVYRYNVCFDCLPKFTTNLKEWKSNNSKAQFIAQNKPEQKELNKRKVSEYWRHKHNRVERSEILRKLYRDDPEYIKRIERSVANSGKVKTNKFGWVEFSGMYELSYIVGCDNDDSIKTLKNYDLHPIQYKRSKESRYRSYFPDFIVNGDTVEIKRELDRMKESDKEIIVQKNKYATSLLGSKFKIIYGIVDGYSYHKRKYVHRYKYKIIFNDEANK